MATILLPKDFKDFLKLLNSNGVKYLVVGGYAVIRMGVPPIRIEILTSISGVEFSDCYKSRVTDVIDGVEVNFINISDLKKNKQAANIHRDLNDLENLP